VNLLHCDDHRLFAESLGAVLRWRGHQVLWAGNPEEALTVATSNAPDVCLMDLLFPGRTGVQAIRQMIGVSPSTRVIVLSACSDIAVLTEAMDAGAIGFAAKDDGVDRVLHLIDRVQGGDVSPRIGTLKDLVGRRQANASVGPALTWREREVLTHLARGESTSAVAQRLGLRYSTARTHIQNVLAKLDTHSRLEAVATAVQQGLVTVEPRE
jgi:two-component system nitrate/nitrite response regulator NarL